MPTTAVPPRAAARRSRAARRLAIAPLALATLTLALVACKKDETGPRTVDVRAYVGQWTGSWRNNTFQTTGPALMTIVENTASSTATLTLDLDGNVFGVGNPPAATFTGPYTSTGFTVSGTSATYGTVTLTLHSDGKLTGGATALPNASVASVDYDGTSDPSEIDLNYTIHFTAGAGGGTATGTITLRK